MLLEDFGLTMLSAVLRAYYLHLLCKDWLTPPILEACSYDRCRQFQQYQWCVFSAIDRGLAQPLAALNASTGTPVNNSRCLR